MNMKRKHSAALVAAAVAVALSQQPAAYGADRTVDRDDTDLEQVIVTGTRRAERTVLESNVPVDVVSEEDLESTAAPDLNTKLQALVPSYSVKRTPPADGSIFVRAASLRNLSPDHTLVLVDGKRFHRSAFVDVTARGAQAVNLALIPSGAFQHVEVLRDGAAAQYGSDAIAGVINFILNDKPGSDVYAQFGENTRGDGRNVQIGASTGFALGANGHLNLTGEFFDGKASNTGIQRPVAAAAEALGGSIAEAVRDFGKVVQRYGLPELRSYKFFANSGYDLSATTSLYAFGNFADQKGVSDFNYRGLTGLTGPDANGVVGPLAGNAAYSLKSNGRASKYQTSGSDSSGSWTAVDPNFSLRALYPGGFTPRFGQDSQDWSLVTGIKGEISPKLNWDLSASAGSNRIDYFINDTINLSLGSASPLDFPDAGSREQREQNVNLDFVYQWQTALTNPVNVAFGAEYRREQFRIRAGQYESWAVGPLRDLAPGSNGFPGAHPATAGDWASHNTAAYLDFDIDVTDRFNVGLAGRVEDYSLFGTTTNGKLAARFAFTDAIALRGAVSTGFRAPTPGQQNLYNVSQSPQTDPLIPRSTNTSGQVPSTSGIAALLGGEALKPEKSVNLSLGLVLQPLPGLSVTLDAYRIDVDDRIGLSKSFDLSNPSDVTPAQLAQIRSSGAPFAGELTNLSFYTNNFDTRTTGLDVVGAWRGDVGPGRLGVTWASNVNKTKFRDYDAVLFNAPTRINFTDSVPKFTSALSADYDWNRWKLLGRARFFGSWTYVASTTASNPIYEDISSTVFLDAVGTFRYSDSVDVSVGVENLLNTYTDKVELITVRNNGRLYPGGAGFENDGRSAYARVNFRF